MNKINNNSNSKNDGSNTDNIVELSSLQLKNENSSTTEHKESLSDRSKGLLNNIVDIYTETGNPVGSKLLCEESDLGLSPASMRNIMADLEKKGYLTSPHTSAGRIPTEEGFRYYANSIVETDDLDTSIKSAIEEKIGDANDLKQTLKNVSTLLGEMTSCAGMITAPRMEMAELKQIEFIRLGGDRVLAVMVTNNDEIENRVITVPEYITEESLNESARHLKDVVAGKTLADARVAMMESLMEHKNQVDGMLSSMMGAAEVWGEPTVSDGALVVSGSQNLFQYPELVRDQLQDLIKEFEEKRMLMALMNEAQKGDGVQVFVGTDCPLEVAKDCSLITTGYGSKDKKLVGTIGVIGPMRMNYKKTMQVIDYTGKVLSRVLEDK